MNGSATHAASAVAIDGRALLIEGPPGSGKSTLAIALIDRGAVLIGDDAVTLEMRGETLWAVPPPNISGKLELRNVGIIELPTTEAPASLVLKLSQDAPRFVEGAEDYKLSGTSVPLLHFNPAIAAAPIRAEWALRQYGLSG